jgi:hypothetical protein
VPRPIWENFQKGAGMSNPYKFHDNFPDMATNVINGCMGDKPYESSAGGNAFHLLKSVQDCATAYQEHEPDNAACNEQLPLLIGTYTELVQYLERKSNINQQAALALAFFGKERLELLTASINPKLV